MDPHRTSSIHQKCKSCRQERPVQDFFRAGGRTHSQYFKSCNACAEIAAARRIRATQRTATSTPTLGGTVNDYRNRPPSVDPDRDMRMPIGASVRLAPAANEQVPIYGRFVERDANPETPAAIDNSIEQNIATPFIDTIINATRLDTDLMRCANIYSYTSTSRTTSKAQYFVQQYALAVRLSALCQYWKQMNLQDWYDQVSSLCPKGPWSHTYDDDEVVPWAPLASWLQLFKAVTRVVTLTELDVSEDSELAKRGLWLVNQLHSTAEKKKGDCQRGIVGLFLGLEYGHCGHVVSDRFKTVEARVEEECVRNGFLVGLGSSVNSPSV